MFKTNLYGNRKANYRNGAASIKADGIGEYPAN